MHEVTRGFAAAALGMISAVSVAYAQDAPVQTYVIEMLNRDPISNERLVFEPPILAINPGDSVRFVARDRGHNAASIPGMHPVGVAPWAGRIGTDIIVKFEVSGTYGIQSLPSYTRGMVALILVGDYTSNYDEARAYSHRGFASRSFDALFALVDNDG